MAADEKLTDLKKAYADIILNTAKEAATRIMLSERKAQRFHRELQVAKDEALRMLLMMKQMMDSKIAEAEAISINQRGKIEELEAQLQEAEDVVKDLRDELRDSESELEWTRNNKFQNLDDNRCSILGTLPKEKKVSSESFLVSPTEIQFLYIMPTQNRILNGMVDPNKENSYNGKESELLYINGCSQSLGASEWDLLPRIPSICGHMSNNEDVKSATSTELITTKGNKVNKNEKKGKKGCNLRPIQSFPVKRKRADRCRRIKSNLSRKPRKSNEASNLPYKEGVVDVGSCVHIDAKTSHVSPHLRMERPEPISSENGHAVKKIKLSEEDSVISAVGTDINELLLPKFNSSKSYADLENLGQPVGERIIKITFQRKRKKKPLNECSGSTCTEKTEKGTSKEEKMDYLVEEHEKI